jgi:hypothetical protein
VDGPGGLSSAIFTARTWSGEQSWSHHGNGFVFASDLDGTTQVYTLPVRGGKPHRLTGVPRAFTSTGARCTIVGTAGADTLVGANGPDTICGLGGTTSSAGAAATTSSTVALATTGSTAAAAPTPAASTPATGSASSSGWHSEGGRVGSIGPPSRLR